MKFRSHRDICLIPNSQILVSEQTIFCTIRSHLDGGGSFLDSSTNFVILKCNQQGAV